MTSSTSLHSLLANSVRKWAERPAVQDSAGTIDYSQLGLLADRLRDRLVARGVGIGDRVGICLRKSIDSVATILGILKSGAAYVPVGPDVPAPRNAFVFSDCSVKAILTEWEFESSLRSELSQLAYEPEILVMERTGGGSALNAMLDHLDQVQPVKQTPDADTAPSDLAYVLYTSGSTGNPKGVMLSHENGLSFVRWCSEVLQPNAEDRFSSHAPFHFDLSILDIYVPLMHGALLVVIGEEVGKDPVRLAALIAETKITVWYSTPSVLTMLTEYGRMENHDYSSLRTVLFAGEVFPIKHLRTLTQMLPHRRYLNLYGPTETNVCTYYELPESIPKDQIAPFPIGHTCSHLRARVLDGHDEPVAVGDSGELCISGPAVMQGYWNLPEQSKAVFVIDSAGQRWYRTGDLVVEEGDGNYRFLGRKDRMIKRRGFRVELGEIEAALYRHPQVREAAAIALHDDDKGVQVRAFVTSAEDRPSIILLKKFCADNLPIYMVPDRFTFLDSLPKTSTDKVDYEKLKLLG